MIRADTGIVLSLPPPQPITAGSHKVRTKWCSILSGRGWMLRTGSVHSKRCTQASTPRYLTLLSKRIQDRRGEVHTFDRKKNKNGKKM